MSKLADLLLAARRAQGWTLAEVEQATRIRAVHLEALENDRFDLLPSPVYTRGFVRNYADFLGLDARQLLRLYEDATGYRPQPVRIERRESIRIAGLMAPNVAAMGIALVLAAILFTWLYTAFFVRDEASTARLVTPVIPTPTALSTVLPPTPTPTPPVLPTAPLLSPTLPIATLVPVTPTSSVVASGTIRPTTAGRLTPTVVLGRGTATATLDPSRLTLRLRVVSAPSWLQVSSDGVVVFTGTLDVGAERTFSAQRELFVHAGRADAVEIFINGVAQGRLSSPGQSVVRRTFTRTTGPAAPAN